MSHSPKLSDHYLIDISPLHDELVLFICLPGAVPISPSPMNLFLISNILKCLAEDRSLYRERCMLEQLFRGMSIIFINTFGITCHEYLSAQLVLA